MIITFDVTNKCAARCPFCIRTNDDNLVPREMSDKVLARIDTMLSRRWAGTDRFKIVTPLGDVASFSRMIPFIQMLNSHGYSVGLISNGILLHKHIPELFTCKIDSMKISTAFNESEFHRIYGHYDYAGLWATIDDLIAHNMPVSLCARQGTDYTKDDLYWKYRGILGKKGIRTRTAWYHLNGGSGQVELPSSNHAFAKKKRTTNTPCALLYSCRISMDGEIQLCDCIINDDLLVGNIFEINSLSKIWQLETTRLLLDQWRAGKYINDTCVRCDMYNPLNYKAWRHRTLEDYRGKAKYLLRHLGLENPARRLLGKNIY